MTTDTASLVRQMRSALVAMHAVQFSTQTVTQRQYEDAKAAGEEAISTADQWLAQQEGDDTDWRAVARVQSAKLAVALDEPGAVARLKSVMRGPDWKNRSSTNQCGETCERAKLCATCARVLEQSCVPLTDECIANQPPKGDCSGPVRTSNLPPRYD